MLVMISGRVQDLVRHMFVEAMHDSLKEKK
jgi:hypothetical protein